MINRNRKISSAIYNTHILYKETNIVKLIDTAPSFIVITTDDFLLEEINNMIKFYNGFVLFSYDTTFEIGDFFVTPLLARHLLFDNEPAIPVAFMFHDSKEEKVHKRFFDWIKEVSFYYYHLSLLNF